MTRRAWGLLVALAAGAAFVASCGGGGGESAGRQVNWYVFDEPSGAFDEAVADCNREAGGRYRVALVPLPTNADQQRELVVRRLAAKDPDIDIIGMDVIWTAEFAEAELDPGVDGRGQARRSSGHARGPARDGAPTRTSSGRRRSPRNTQLLWYRKDRVDRRRPRPGTR